MHSILSLDFEETMDRGLRRRTSRTGRRNLGGMDLDDVEDAVRSMQQDTQDIRTEFVSYHNNIIFPKTCKSKKLFFLVLTFLDIIIYIFIIFVHNFAKTLVTFYQNEGRAFLAKKASLWNHHQ